MRTIFMLLMCFVSFSIFAQNTVLQGIIIDAESKEPLTYATVAVFNGDAIIDGTSTNENGTFRLQLNSEFTAVEFSFISYNTLRLEKANLNTQDDNQIQLQPTVENLNEVVIQGEQTTVKMEIDRKIVRLGSDLQQAGTNALEAFDQLTEVQTDLSTGTLSLRGSSNIRLLINGKPSGISPGELLNQIPSSSIDRIEIITVPSAKNQADGISGIVNIILKKNAAEGLNLNLNGGGGNYRYTYGTSGNFSKGIINTRFNWSKNIEGRTSDQTLKRSYINGTTEDIFTPHIYNGDVNRINIGIDFFPNRTIETSLDYEYIDDYHSFENTSLYANLTDSDDFTYLRASEHYHFTHTGNFNIRHTLGKPNHFIELDYNLNTNDNRFPASDFRNNTFVLDETYDYDNTLHFLGLDYALPLNENITLESGFVWNKRILKSDYAFRDDNITSNDAFDYDETICASYLQARWKLSKLTLQAGLRYEYFESQGMSTQQAFLIKKDFSNFFPSIHLFFKFSDKQELNMGYSTRITRPNFRHLNPFQLGNPYFQFVGNVELEPEFSHNFDVNYQYNSAKLDVSLSSFFRVRSDVIQRIDRFGSDGVQVASYINGGNNKSIGIESTITYKPFKFWNSTISANYFYTFIEDDDLVTWNELYSSVLQWRNTFKVSKKFTMDISYRHDPKQQQAFRFYNPRNRLDVAARARLLKNKLSLNLRIVDVLNTNIQERFTRTQSVRQDEAWIFATQTRNLLLSANFRIFENETLKRNRKKRDYRHGGTTD